MAERGLCIRFAFDQEQAPAVRFPAICASGTGHSRGGFSEEKHRSDALAEKR